VCCVAFCSYYYISLVISWFCEFMRVFEASQACCRKRGHPFCVFLLIALLGFINVCEGYFKP
jgi:hypothetical protein